MNMNRLINMILRRFLGRAMRMGADHLARSGKAPGEMTGAEREQYRNAQQTTRKARQAARLTRRFMR